ncbi:DNA polymerase III subunit delta' [Thetidibacter halocola]|uniref:DNA polymerase III subunit delta n=1 Tax=Thetidibacter halocola TaxID=2827239 RepID=A0A8J8B9J0_9RHOB|nr:DNA polymerase III subunit delta' [Thetidibacter halocola]MBS0126557.1 DNA polymerase III subunit delta' [Thetidibacter halocola]
MSDLIDLPEPDVIAGAPHPRMAPVVLGQAAAEAEFLAAHASGRLHHGWLLTGAQGTGKATLAWAMARFLLTTPEESGDGLFGAPPPPQDLHVEPEHPVARRMRALSEPGLFLLRRGPTDKGDKLAAQISVGEVRKLHRFFSLSAADGGRRVVIVDAADELNMQAANALLKMLEEPPARTTLLLISHQPARLLPTIRSRCRTLRLAPLAPADMARALDQAGVVIAPEDAGALAELAGGSAGAAIRLVNLDGLALYRELLAVLASLPTLDRGRMMALSETAGRKGAEDRLGLLLTLTDQLCARIARTGATGHPPAVEIAPGEGKVLTRLAPDARAAQRWAAAAQAACDRARHARAVNIDPASLVTDLVLHLARAV